MASVYIHEIKLEGEGKFVEQFNKCSDYWQKGHDELLSEEERELNLQLWFEEKQRLELGIY